MAQYANEEEEPIHPSDINLCLDCLAEPVVLYRVSADVNWQFEVSRVSPWVSKLFTGRSLVNMVWAKRA